VPALRLVAPQGRLVVLHQRQWLDHATLAANHDFPGPPMNVVKFEQNDLPGSQPESGEQQ